MRVMIIKSFSLVIAGMVVGGEAVAKHMRDSPPLSTTTTDTAPNSIASATTPSSLTASYFTSSWTSFPNPNFSPVSPGQNVTFGYTVLGDVTPTTSSEPHPDLILLYTTAETVPDTTNTYQVLSINNYTCYLPSERSGEVSNSACSFVPGTSGTATLDVEVNDSQVEAGVNMLSSFFLCFAVAVNKFTPSLTCESYSNFFGIDISNSTPAGSQGLAMRAVDAVSSGLSTPTATLDIVSATQIVTSRGTVPTISGSLSPAGTVISSLTTISLPTSVVTITPAAAATASQAASQASKSSGLSVGAKVGIALGAIAFVLLSLILGLFCLRRRRNTRTQPEHVMLTQNMHTGSRDLIAEKETSGPRASIIETPIQEYLPPSHIPSSSHALSPYDDTPSAPYAGPAAAVPRRKPTAATVATTVAATVSRGISDASAPLSPRSGTTRRGGGEDFEEYHDEPVYGDARHVPQIYEGSSSQAPFLSSRGMTAEELEEERRIDLAIAEAERR